MINKWISKRSGDVAGKFEIHRNQGDITEKRNEQKIQIMYKLEISREIHLESTWNSQNKKVQDLVLSSRSIFL